MKKNSNVLLIEASRKSLSDANDAATQEREGQQSLLQLVSERSIVDEEIRKEQAQREFEEELLKAIDRLGKTFPTHS